ncbi:glycosyltransferase family 1 protein [Candidatus Saccharibacteria bacterium]|nr:glycosyltransferase family 1 protein [Candidatus Saccharibacteria bacterium]
MFISKQTFRTAFKTFKDEGVTGFLIKSLEFVRKSRTRKSNSQKHRISLLVKYDDLIKVDLSSPPVVDKNPKIGSLVINWLMPPPGKGSGGHMNIFRFIQYAEKAGHECRIYLYADGGKGSVQPVLDDIGSSYPETEAVKTMTWLDQREMDEADILFATSWQTAYAVYNSTLSARRFYFVQDFEPYFFPTGSLYSLAENTYKFGFYGVTAGGWLAKKLRGEYDMETDHFDFGADESLYSYKTTGNRNEIFFYARPYTARRGFELGIVALTIFHKKHPEYTINLAGSDVSEYEIPFPYNNLKTLEPHELNNLYNKCAAGLVLSLTNMSLLPLELLSSGTIPVVNSGENNRLVSNNPYIAYTDNTPLALANKLSEIVERNDLPGYALAASKSIPNSSWDSSGKKFVSILEREMGKEL